MGFGAAVRPPAVQEHSVGELLAASGLPALEARALLAYQLGVARERLIARPDQRVTSDDGARFIKLTQRRQRGEPLAYLTGEREFHGRTFAVTPAVLIPRPETELLVETALRIGPRGPGSVLDLGTGSGCIAITLALERPHWHVTATDMSTAALDIGRVNAARLQARVMFRGGDWFGAVGDACFDLIVANPPYVAIGDPHLDDLTHEPLHALVAGEDGLECLRAIIDAAPLRVSPGGRLAFEHGYDQAAAVRELLAVRGWDDIQTLADLTGHQRVTSARWPSAV
jgi:release factor glutamine methyltransferase